MNKIDIISIIVCVIITVVLMEIITPLIGIKVYHLAIIIGAFIGVVVSSNIKNNK